MDGSGYVRMAQDRRGWFRLDDEGTVLLRIGRIDFPRKFKISIFCGPWETTVSNSIAKTNRTFK